MTITRRHVLDIRNQRLWALLKQHHPEIMWVPYQQVPMDHPVKEYWWKLLRAHDRASRQSEFMKLYPRPSSVVRPAREEPFMQVTV